MEVRDRILIIEDDRSIRKFFRTILEANRYDVISADTGEEGYSLITSQCPDLVILDLGLPDIDGMEILSRLRKWSGMPVVVISARSHEKDKVEALDLGADDYITKPFGTSEMLARIRAAIRHSRTGEDYQQEEGRGSESCKRFVSLIDGTMWFMSNLQTSIYGIAPVVNATEVNAFITYYKLKKVNRHEKT